jgi:2-hydroxychromene-2-carboxylate isomerase
MTTSNPPAPMTAPPPARRLDCYIFVGSTYSFLTAHRAAAFAAAHGVVLDWKPFSLRTLLREQDSTPFLGRPAKTAYMWRDIERRAARFGIPFARPSRYPVDAAQRANRIATLAAREGWCAEFLRETYRTWFLEDRDPGDPDALADTLHRLGRPATVAARADAPDVEAEFKVNTDAARTLGMFGAPNFVCEGEVFWGDDRLEDAIAWRLRT